LKRLNEHFAKVSFFFVNFLWNSGPSDQEGRNPVWKEKKEKIRVKKKGKTF